MNAYTGNTYTLLHNLDKLNKHKNYKKYVCECASCIHMRKPKPVIYRKTSEPIVPLTPYESRPNTAIKQLLGKRKMTVSQQIVEKMKQLKTYYVYEEYAEDFEDYNDDANDDF